MKDNQKEEFKAAIQAEIPIGVCIVPEEENREIKLKERVDFYIEKFKTMTEKEFVDIEPYDEPRARTLEDLLSLINALVERNHDYGTCVYAMTHAALVAFNYVAYKLGVTGFQAGCADLSFIQRTRRYNNGFRIIDYNKLLYPQYFDNPKYFPTAHQLLEKNYEQLSKKAKELLTEKELAHPNVKKHWKWICDLQRECDGRHT